MLQELQEKLDKVGVALIEIGDIEESIRAAQAIGDDRLQTMVGQRVNPETFTHGTSAQRAKWFKRGVEAGALSACDTFAATDEAQTRPARDSIARVTDERPCALSTIVLVPAEQRP